MKIRLKKILKYTGIVLLSIILLVIALIVSLRFPAVQNFVKDKLIVYLQDKIKTKVSLESVYIGFPNTITLNELYLQGQQVDTLLYVSSLDVGLNLPKLLNNTADLTSVDLEGVRANVVRDSLGKFNFDYIIDAFATKDEEESESKPFIISLDKIAIKKIDVTFIDALSSNDIRVKFNEFNTRVKTFDLDKNNYAIDDIALDGLRLKLKQGLVKEVAEKVEEKTDSLAQKNPFSIALNTLALTDIMIDYGDDNSKTYASIVFDELRTKIKSIDLGKNEYLVDKIALKNSTIKASLFLPSEKKTEDEQQKAKTNGNPIALKLNQLNLEDIAVVYDNTAEKPSNKGIDFNHLDFSKIDVDLRDFSFTDQNISGSLKNTFIAEKSGLQVNKLQTDFSYGSSEAFLKDLYLETPKTVIQDEVILQYTSIEQLTNDLGNVEIQANLQKTKIAFSDILILAPDLKNTPPFSTNREAVLLLNTSVNGKIDDLFIEEFQLSGLDKTIVNLSGQIKNATNPDKLWFDLNVKQLETSSKTIQSLVPKGTIPNTIQIPSFLSLNGKAKGSVNNFVADLNLKTSDGNAKLKAVLDQRIKDKEKYVVDAVIQNLNVGKIIKNDSLGRISATIKANGTSFNPEKAQTKVNGYISSAEFNSYTYKDIALDAKINQGNFEATIVSKDENAKIDLLASGYYSKDNPSIKIDGTVEKLDLYKLRLYQKPFAIAGKINGDFSNLSPDALNGNLYLQDFALSDGKEIYPLSEIKLEAVSNENENRISLHSQIADAELTGRYKLTQILGSVQQTIDQYYHFMSEKDKVAEIEPNQYFDFNVKIKNDDLIQKFVPDLKEFQTITLDGSYQADARKLIINGSIPQLTYGTIKVDSVALNIANNDAALQYGLSVYSIENENMAVDRLGLTGAVSDNKITYDLRLLDQEDNVQYGIAGNVESINEVTKIALNQNGLKLNYEDWNVNPDNNIQISDAGILAHQFFIQNANSQLGIQSENEIPNSPLNITIKGFEIETITEIIKKDSLLAQGTIDGTVQLRDLKNNMTFTSDINVNELKVYGSEIGNLAVKVDNNQQEVLNADVTLTGFENDLKVAGNYNIQQKQFDLSVNINKLQMKSVQGFSMKAIDNAVGYISGALKVTGTADDPSILGDVKFNGVGMDIASLNTTFKNIDDTIAFTSEGIQFKRFKIDDADGNSLTINGKILTKTYRDFAFGLNVNASDFKVVNSTKKENNIMYGIMAIDANLNIRGNLDLPKVDGQLTVSDKTDFTFVLPQSSPALQDREGIVEFIDQDQIALQGTLEPEKEISEATVKGLDVSVNIEVKKEAKLSVVIDKSNGDFVKLQGEAELTGGVDPSGKITLVGRYEVNKGSYEMSVNLLKRKFDIKEGSSITWTGEPTKADTDITAVYKTNTAPLDLVQQQLSRDDNPAEYNMYKQRIPFETLLMMKGELLKPEITFDITVDEDNASVSSEVISVVKTKLDQLRTEESEMNKQVFALLLLNRFIGENPFESSAGMSAESMARQSVSKILSQQLNNLASDLIAGVELNFDLESTEDYSTGEQNTRTDLNVGLSKKLLNDRLKVNIGSNFGLEGEQRQNEQMTNIAGDISLDYMLSKDGRYTLRAYRKNEYQVALQGQIIETGVGFIITIDYNEFREIYRKNKRNQQQRRNAKKQQNQYEKTSK